MDYDENGRSYEIDVQYAADTGAGREDGVLSEFLLLMKHELVATAILFVLLVLKLGRARGNDFLYPFVNALLVVNFLAGFLVNGTGELFAGMFHTDATLAMEKNILNLGVLLISLQSGRWLKAHPHLTEFYLLLLSTLIGMFLMISSGHLLLFFLGLELSTIPLAAMANFDLSRRTSSEAAMKMILSSAFSSGILLFGISLVYGTTGSLSFRELPALADGSLLQLLAFLVVFTGFAFKMSAVPFHLWTADVYEGSPVAVTAFLSVISKGAILFVFTSVLFTVFRPIAQSWYQVLYLTSVLTLVIGNLFALRQQNMKRFLAFSSIAQVGFILIGISGGNREAMASVIFFILVYVFSNLGAFGVISLVSAVTGKERVDDYKGFYANNKLLSWVLALSLFSLAGIPPTAGFFGKFFLLSAGASAHNYPLLTIAALNMIVSLYYYLRIVRAVFMDRGAEPMQRIDIPLAAGAALVICLAGVLVLGFAPGVYAYIYSLSSGM